MAHHDDHHHEVEYIPMAEPAWAKCVAPLCALAILGYLYCAYQHLV